MDKSYKKERGIRIDSCIELLFVLYVFWYIQPYFTWDTYYNGILKEYGGILYTTIFFLLIVVFIFMRYFNQKIKLHNYKVYFALTVAIAPLLYLGICGNNYQLLFSGLIIPYLILSIYILLPDKIKVKIYKLYIFIFAITLIPAILYYILELIGFSIPHGILSSYEKIKVSMGVHYKLYPLAVQQESINSMTASLRLCGIYDEAGKLGTMAALFLTAERYQIKNNKINIIVLLAGALTFSLSFYVITILYYILDNIMKRKLKNILALFMIVIAYIVFVNINIDIPIVKTLQSRILITSTGISGDNRTNVFFEELFNEFKNSDIKHILFGYGEGAIGIVQNTRNIDGSSYKSLIYNYGYVGFGISIIWIICWAIVVGKKYKNCFNYIIIFTIIYLMNIYQRPSLFYPPYMIIYIGGIYYWIQKQKMKQGENNESINFNGSL